MYSAGNCVIYYNIGSVARLPGNTFGVISDNIVNSDFSWPRITVVTPSYNQGQFIEETILSVISQGYPNLDYIIIDGGSTDNTIEIIIKYEKYISFWISEPDNGQTNAINKGFMKGTGEIFAWINSDDLYSPGTLFEIARIFAEHPDFDLVYGDCIYINEKSAQLSYFKSQQFDFRKLLKSDFIPQPSTFWRAKVFQSIGSLDESFQYAMDYDYWIRISIKFPMHYIPIPFSCFRWHSQSKSVAESNYFLLDHLKIYNYIINNQKISPDTKKEIYLDTLWSYLKFNVLSKKNKDFSINQSYLSPELKKCLETSVLFFMIDSNKIIGLQDLENCLFKTWICLEKIVDGDSVKGVDESRINDQYLKAINFSKFLFINRKWLLSFNFLLIIVIKKPKLLLNRVLYTFRCRLKFES